MNNDLVNHLLADVVMNGENITELHAELCNLHHSFKLTRADAWLNTGFLFQTFRSNIDLYIVKFQLVISKGTFLTVQFKNLERDKDPRIVGKVNWESISFIYNEIHYAD